MPRKRIWKSAEITLLGTVSDAALAKQLGISPAAVFQKRCAVGVPAFEKRFRAWGVTELTMLGRYADAEIAKLSGRPLEDVLLKRKELGVAAPKIQILHPKHTNSRPKSKHTKSKRGK